MIEITLQSEKILKGKFVGFSEGDTTIGENYISKWHFVNEGNGFDSFGDFEGEYIFQKEIFSIKFLEDNSVMYFVK